jgi:two-component system, sensor histidine kinase and response regulator
MLKLMTASTARVPLHTATILVVDDNLQNRLLAEARLLVAGYRVLQADSGAQALEIFATQQCDLVLLDVRMPAMDGFETLDRLRRLPRGADVAVVFLTALDDVATHERALKAGVDDYLTKPLRATELLIRVRSLIRLSQAMESLRANHRLVSSQRDELIRARDLRKQLSTYIVHDLKSPLSMVMAASDLMRRRPGEDNSGTLQIVQRAAQNMLRMVHNLLDIARSEDVRLVARPRSFDLRELIDELVQSVRGTKGEWHSGIAFETRYMLDDSWVCADAALLRRVLENLLDNALRYSPTDACIRIEVSRGEHDLTLVVRDEGPGIAPEQRERIFEMYVQLDDVNPMRVGHGLGLVFCRLAIEAQGGRIWAESGDDGHGAAFHVRLPIG